MMGIKMKYIIQMLDLKGVYFFAKEMTKKKLEGNKNLLACDSQPKIGQSHNLYVCCPIPFNA